MAYAYQNALQPRLSPPVRYVGKARATAFVKSFIDAVCTSKGSSEHSYLDAVQRCCQDHELAVLQANCPIDFHQHSNLWCARSRHA